jgi:hypothetical protein
MRTPIVTEIPRRTEPAGFDPFIEDLRTPRGTNPADAPKRGLAR